MRFWALWLLLVACLAACGSNPDDTSSDAGYGGAHDAGAYADAEDDFQGCPAEIPSFEPGLRAIGEHLAVKLIAAMPAAPERYLNSWTVELGALDGSPAPDAEIVRGETFMPVHGHDGRVQPRMTALAAPGQFQVDRLNFSMRGPWEVRFWLRSGSLADDYVVFDVCVAK